MDTDIHDSNIFAMTNSPRLSSRGLLLLATIIAITLVIWFSEPRKWLSTFAYESVSPGGLYRLEIRTTSYSIDHGFVRLYNNHTGKLMDESDVVWLTGNAQQTWPSKRDRIPTIGVGMDVAFAVAPEPEKKEESRRSIRQDAGAIQDDEVRCLAGLFIAAGPVTTGSCRQE